MQEKVTSRREINRRYKGKAPVHIDRIIAWWSKLILQLLIFSFLYTMLIAKTRAKYDNFFIEFLFVCFWLMISDISAFLISLVIKILFNYRMNYLPSDKKKGKNYNRIFYEYLFYTLFRCVSYISGLTPLLASFLYSIMPYFWGFFAYFLAWFIIFIGCKGVATVLSIVITKSV